MAQHSKRYRALREKIKSAAPVPLAEAVRILKSFNTTKFNQTVEVSTHLGIDPKQTDQNVRGSVALAPRHRQDGARGRFRTGRKRRKGESRGSRHRRGRRSGPADQGRDDGLRRCALATPDMMGVVGPLGRVLGPRGLMPSPRSGTVTTDITAAVREFKAGKIEFRSDKGGNVAVPVGKIGFTEEQLTENIATFLNYLRSLKPAAAKGTYIRSITVSATMSPGIRVSA